MKKSSKEKDHFSGRYRCRGHIWIEGREGTFLGYGRVALLERIRDYGSITKAAKSLEMSYRRAWIMVDSMNRQAPKPYVVTSSGGKNGGGTLVTKEGEEAVKMFWKIHHGLQNFLAKAETSSGLDMGEEKEFHSGTVNEKRRIA